MYQLLLRGTVVEAEELFHLIEVLAGDPSDDESDPRSSPNQVYNEELLHLNYLIYDGTISAALEYQNIALR